MVLISYLIDSDMMLLCHEFLFAVFVFVVATALQSRLLRRAVNSAANSRSFCYWKI